MKREEPLDVPDDSGSLYPSSARARAYKRWCDRRVLLSIHYLSRVVERGLHTSFEVVRSRIDLTLARAWEPDQRLSSLAHLYHSNLRLAVQAQEPDAAIAALTAFETVPFFAEGIRAEPLGQSSWPEAREGDIRNALNRSSIITYGTPMGIDTPDSRSALRMRGALAYALATIGEIDAELSAELATYVTDIVYYQSTKTTSGSSFNCLGLVSMNCITIDQNWTTALEMLVHEAAHQHVFSVMASQSLILNEGQGMFASTLRKDPRPLSGIFHAMVVVARLNYLAARLWESGILERERVALIPARNNAGNNMPYRAKFTPLVDVLRAHAELSNLGWRMVESCCEIASINVPKSAFAK